MTAALGGTHVRFRDDFSAELAPVVWVLDGAVMEHQGVPVVLIHLVDDPETWRFAFPHDLRDLEGNQLI